MILLLLFCVINSNYCKLLPLITHHVSKQFQSQVQLQQNTNNAISLDNIEQNLLYSISLGIGTPPQNINFQVDTGSDILWMYEQTDSSQGFNQKQSSSIFISTQPYNIYYLKGYAKGFLCIDKISLQNTTISTNLQFMLANNVSEGIQPDGIFGIMGMGYTKTQNFLDAAWENGQISTNTFTLSLSGPSGQSYLYFDDIPEQILQQTYYFPVFNHSYWSGETQYFTTDDQDFTQYISNLSVIDSGTTNIFFNSQLYNAIYSYYFEQICKLDYYGQPICQCPLQVGGSAKWPTLAIAIGNIELYLPPQSYVNDDQGTCYLKIFSGNLDQLLLGDILFRQYNITFSKQQSQIGFQGDLSVLQYHENNFFIYSQFVLFGIIGILVFYGFAVILLLKHALSSESSKYGKIMKMGQIYKLHLGTAHEQGNNSNNADIQKNVDQIV